MIYLVEAEWPSESEILFIVKTKKEAIAAARTEAENFRASGGYGPTSIQVSRWSFDEQDREPVGSIQL